MGEVDPSAPPLESAPPAEPDPFRISLAELVVILGVVFLLAVILIPIARSYSGDKRRLDQVEKFKPKSEAPAEPRGVPQRGG